MNIIKLVVMAVVMGFIILAVAIWKLFLSIAGLAIAIPVTIAFFVFGKRK